MDERSLVFVESIGNTPDGNFIYRFLFSDEPDVVWGDKFNIIPASSVNNLHPLPETISEEWRVVSSYELQTAVKSDWFSMQDCIDEIIAIAFTTDDNTTLLFHFGDSQIQVKSLLEKTGVYYQAINYVPPTTV